MTSIYPCLSLNPAGSTLEKDHFTGELFRGLYKRVNVAYPNSFPTLPNAEQGAENLDNALHAVTGKRLVCGASMGAQVIYKWMRDYGPDSTIDPADVAFISSGNMERKYGGGAHVDGANILGVPIIAGYGGNGLPDPCPWRVIDVARQYDPFADYPAAAGSPSENEWQDNVNKSFALIVNNPHKDYTKVSLVDPASLWFNEGTVSYVFVPTFPLPMVAKTYWYLVASLKAKREAVLRPKVEAGYDRPYENIPQTAPVVKNQKWLPWGWNTTSAEWERVHRQTVERQPPLNLFF